MMEARNLRNMTVAQTPLLGEENTPMHIRSDGGTGFEGATPRHQVAFTPNPLATPAHQEGSGPGATPRSEFSGATPLRTPLRDNLSLNNGDTASLIGATPRGNRALAHATSSSLKAAFQNLPKPENNFELLVPEDEEEEEIETTTRQEDAAERDARIKRQKEEAERKALARRSLAVQQGLPRPARVDVDQLLQNLSLDTSDEDAGLSEARKLVNVEMVKLLQHDTIAFPLPGTSLPGGTRSTYEIPEDEYISEAKSLVNSELASSLGFPNATPTQVAEGLVAIAKTEEVSDDVLWDKERERLAYDAKTSSWVDPTSLSDDDRLVGYESLLKDARALMAKEASKANKAEKKLGIQLGGYEARFRALTKRVADAFDETQRGITDLDSFTQLHINEQALGPRRVEALQREVDTLEQRERRLQERYAELARDKEESEARLVAMEEKAMEEAEALNEAALAEMDS